MTAAWQKVVQAVVVSLVVGVVVLGGTWVGAAKTGPIPRSWQIGLQSVGAFLAFVGVYAKLGWSIQTFAGNTRPEVFNEWFFRIVTGLGMVCVFYATFVKVKGG